MRTFTNDGRVYEWVGGFGAIFKSRERGRYAGDVRMIAGELFYVFDTYPKHFRKAEVLWTQQYLTAEHIRELQAKVFGIALSLTPAPAREDQT